MIRALLSASLLALAAPIAGADVDLAVRADTLHTSAGEPIADAVVLIDDDTIAAVGPASQIEIPDGVRVLRAAVVTPGLIDARATVGLTGILNQDQDQDQLERSEPIQPALRAIDAFNIHDELVSFVRSFGVTTVHTGHAPGEVISGQTMITKTAGNTVEDALLVETAAVAATLSPSARKSGGKSPGTRAKMIELLRQRLLDAREYARKQQGGQADTDDENEADADDDNESTSGPARDIELETLARVIEGELPLMITANRAQDIANALRVAEEFNVTLWLDMAAEAYLLTDQIKDAGVPVLIHPTMYRAFGETENLSFETAANLADAGIPVAMTSGYEGYVPKVRVVLYEAAWAAANGMGFDRALRACTIDAATILGIQDRVGSVEVGKHADLALYDGDPFEYLTHCTAVIIEGRVVSDQAR